MVPIFFVLICYFDYVGAGPGYLYTGNAFPVNILIAYLAFAVPPLLGLLVSIKSFFPAKSGSRSGPAS